MYTDQTDEHEDIFFLDAPEPEPDCDDAHDGSYQFDRSTISEKKLKKRRGSNRRARAARRANRK